MHQQRYNFHGSCAFYIHHLKSSTNKSSEPILEHMVNSIPMDFSLVLSSIPVGSSCRTRPSHKSSWSVTGFPWNMDDDHPPKRCFRKPKKHWWTGMSHRFTNGFQYKWGIMRIYDLIAIEWWFQMVVLHGTKKNYVFEFTREMIPKGCRSQASAGSAGFSFLRLPWWHNYLVAHLPKSCLSQLGSTWKFPCSQVSCVIWHAAIYSTMCLPMFHPVQSAIEGFHKWGYP